MDTLLVCYFIFIILFPFQKYSTHLLKSWNLIFLKLHHTGRYYNWTLRTCTPAVIIRLPLYRCSINHVLRLSDICPKTDFGHVWSLTFIIVCPKLYCIFMAKYFFLKNQATSMTNIIKTVGYPLQYQKREICLN